jgi:hypothetical protein
MSAPNSRKRVPASGVNSSSGVTNHRANSAARLAAGVDGNLEDWDAYYQLLLAGQLNEFAGEFIVIHQGSVVAHGFNPEELRSDVAKQFSIAGDKLVILFVDNKECTVPRARNQ